MPNYKKMYFMLFNQVTDAIAAIESFCPAKARTILMKAQRLTEELYISAQD